MHPAARVLHEEVAKGRTPGLQYLHFGADSIMFRYMDGVADVARRRRVERTTTFNGLSVTKTVTATAILQLVESGALELDRPAAECLPAFPYPDDITIRQLLTHAAGVPNPIPLRWTHGEAEHASFDRDAFFAREFAKHDRVKSAPNERFAYSNLGFQLLGQVIESVSGMPFERYVSESILERVGLSGDELGFTLDTALHARGYHRRRSLSYPLLGLFMDRAKAFEGREGAWQAFRPYYMNGPAYGGLIGTADGFARYVQTLLDPANALLSPVMMSALFTENILRCGAASGICLSWFTGVLDGEPYFDHAGGGGGYYAELRIYPRLRRGSVLLFNRTGVRNVHFLDRVDGHLI